MSEKEWSRSRYWLFHFLQSRHLRPKFRWPPRAIGTRLSQALALALPAWSSQDRAWLTRRLADRARCDPAWVQAVRLMVREADHHEHLLGKWSGTARVREPEGNLRVRFRALRCRLGVRFELSRVLLLGLIRSGLMEAVERYSAADDDLTRTLMRDLRRELDGHRQFLSEWLTAEFADFNFVRRNLRRWRLRLMFASLLSVHLLCRGALIRRCGTSPIAFALEQWRGFARMLEEMVPYRREALLTALLNQREYPWGAESSAARHE
ncbi:MAG: hypothetical protein JJU36_10925 [Phycisphaeraceae bacterium]|nr:hypothetical protein [Phycisphaeraceae bacterium]